jgi:hypothetical protein
LILLGNLLEAGAGRCESGTLPVLISWATASVHDRCLRLERKLYLRFTAVS